jgi:hypothetical protein
MPGGRPKQDPPPPPRRTISVSMPVDLIDALEVECEMAVVGRSKALSEGAVMWINRQREGKGWPPYV